MRYLKTAFVILLLFVVIIFCVHNKDLFSLSFQGFPPMISLPLWLLMLIFFTAGMVPIFLVEISRLVGHYKKMKSLKTRIAEMENQLARPPSSSPEESK